MGCGASKVQTVDPKCAVCERPSSISRKPYRCDHVVCASCFGPSEEDYLPLRCPQCTRDLVGKDGHVCPQHGLEFVYHCTTHRQLACRECHRLEHNTTSCTIKTIDTSVNSPSLNNDISTLEDRLTDNVTRLTFTSDRILGTQHSLIEQKDAIFCEMADIRKSVIEKMKNLEDRVQRAANMHHDNQTNILEDEMSKCEVLQTKMRKVTQDLNTITRNETQVQKLRRYYVALSRLDDHDKAFHDVVNRSHDVQLELVADRNYFPGEADVRVTVPQKDIQKRVLSAGTKEMLGMADW